MLSRRMLVGVVSASLVAASAALAQVRGPEPRQLLADFIHYVKIDQRQAAIAVGQQLLDLGLSPQEWVGLVEDSGEAGRFVEAIVLAQKQGGGFPELEAAAGKMDALFSRGKLERVRNDEEIARNIELLTGSQRGRLLARERLVAAGEYATPRLLDALLQRENPHLQVEAYSVLVDLGRQSVGPLSTALTGLPTTSQDRVVRVLESVGYATAIAAIVDVRETTQVDSLRATCQRALSRLAGDSTVGDSATEYLKLAQGYYDEKTELTSFPGETTQILWSYDPSIGLVPTAILTPVYHEAMAMRLSEASLRRRQQGNSGAISLWIAANLRREIESPANYTNPAYAADRRAAEYYAVASGADAVQHVLASAIKDRNTQLAFRAVKALQQTAAGATLWTAGDAGAPLLSALQYPNRRVRYEAALALAAAAPATEFPGADRVVPTLAGAIREASQKFAVVISGDTEVYQQLRAIAEGMGFIVLPEGRRLNDVAAAVAETPGIDLIIASLPVESSQSLVAEARESSALSASPVLLLTSPQGYIDLGLRYRNDDTVAVRQSGIGREAMVATINALVQAASGGIIAGPEAVTYQRRALGALRDLAIGGTSVFDVADATVTLIRALEESDASMRLDIADILARVDEKRAQVALMDAALRAQGADRVQLLRRLADSARRFGNRLETRQVEQLVRIAETGQGEEATAAAAAMGTLNLPYTNLVPLILGRGG